MELTGSERETLRLLADALVPRTGDPEEPLGGSASDLGVHTVAEEAIASVPPAVRREFRRLLRAVDNPMINLLLVGRPMRFRARSPEARERYLLNWAHSRIGAKRRGFHSIKRLVCFLYYSTVTDGRTNPNWREIGYDAPENVGAATPSDLKLEPLAVDRETTLETDLVVVGSGAGGAVIAATAAKAGHRVVVVEAGPFLTPETFTRRELPGTESMLERRGLLTTRDNAFGVLQGHTAGGATTVNWMTCLRPPPWLLQEWERDFGIPGLTEPRFGDYVNEVWDRLGVNAEEAVMTPPSQVLRRGCETLGLREGVDFHVTPKNARACANRCDYCNFGCVYSAKQSTLVTYLPDAQRHGARLLFDAEARTIEVRDGRAVGVEAVHRQDGREVPVHIRARVVVAAAGAVQTPAVLLRSGFRHPGIGRGIRFHPTTAVGAVYGEPIRMWSGVPQTLHVDRWLNLDGQHHGFWLETVPAHPGLTALGLPWRGGRDHKERMRLYSRIAANIILVRERSAGRVTIDGGGNAIVDYRMAPQDRDTMVRGIVESARIHGAAGAQAIWSLHLKPCDIQYREGLISEHELDGFANRVRELGVRPNGVALFTAHAMGSVPMGSVDSAPTRPTGALRGLENLFIGDASVFPSAPGVNPMITVMAMARRTVDFVVRALRAST